VCFEKQLLVRGQAGGVGEEHAEGDVAAARVEFAAGVGQKFGDDSGYGGIQFEESAFVEDGSHGGSGDWFGEGCQVEDRAVFHGKILAFLEWGGTWGSLEIFFIDKAAKGFQGDQFSSLSYRDRGCGEGALGDGFLEDREGRREPFVLIFEGRVQ